MLLKDKVVVLTGAGRGIGRSAALIFAREGATQVLAARTAAQLDETAQQVRAQGRTAICVPTDVTVESQVQALIARAVKEFGRIDVLVNNAAGSSPTADLVEKSMADWDATVAGSLRSTAMCAKYALKHMVPRRQGNIINNASRSGRVGIPGRTDYSSAKAGVIAFTHALAREVARHNIRVNCVVPGAIESPSLHRWFHTEAERRGITVDQVKATYMAEAGTLRLPTTDEVAEIMLFLASDRSSGMHGQAIDVNGGSWMS